MLTLRRVVGPSMEPTLKQGQLVIALKSKQYKPGQIIIAQQNKREVIKRIASIRDDFYTLAGDNTMHSTDSRHYGSVNKRDILGRVVFIL